MATIAVFRCSYDSKKHGLIEGEGAVLLAPGVTEIPAEHMDGGIVRAKRDFKRHTLELPNVPLKKIECEFSHYIK